MISPGNSVNFIGEFSYEKKLSTWPADATLVVSVTGNSREAFAIERGCLSALRPCGQPELWELGGFNIGQFFLQTPRKSMGADKERSCPAVLGPVHLRH